MSISQEKILKPEAKPWALITGASSGIGRALAHQFAQEGYNLVAVARNGERLRELARELSEEQNVLTKVIVHDLAKPSACEEIFKVLTDEGIAIDVLVNNAGFGVHGEYAKTDLSREIDMVNLHITSLLQLTKFFMPQMLTRNFGRILNVASVYSYSSVPMQSVYSASKSFMLSFSESLRNEIRGKGVSVTVLCPGITRTEFRKRMGVGEKKAAKGMDPAKVAAIGYKALMRGKFIAIPGVGNKTYVWFARMTPRSLMSRVIRKINFFRGINQHA
jgi:hypothetical protein